MSKVNNPLPCVLAPYMVGGGSCGASCDWCPLCKCLLWDLAILNGAFLTPAKLRFLLWDELPPKKPCSAIFGQHCVKNQKTRSNALIRARLVVLARSLPSPKKKYLLAATRQKFLINPKTKVNFVSNKATCSSKFPHFYSVAFRKRSPAPPTVLGGVLLNLPRRPCTALPLCHLVSPWFFVFMRKSDNCHNKSIHSSIKLYISWGKGFVQEEIQDVKHSPLLRSPFRTRMTFLLMTNSTSDRWCKLAWKH